MGLGLVLAAAAMRRRSKRATGLERQQLKWITFAAAIAGVMIAADIISFFVASDEANLNLLRTVTLGIGFSVIPVAAGIAILRYRLYDIDVVINRTVVYGTLTATLVAVYLGSILLMQLVLRTFTAGSGLAVAASTLACRGARCVRPGLGSRRSSTAASTAASTTRPGRSTISPLGCATRSIWRLCRATSAPSWPKPCSPRTSRSGCAQKKQRP